VEAALQAAAGGVTGLDDPRRRGSRLRLGGLPFADVAQVAREGGRPGDVDARDRQLDRATSWAFDRREQRWTG
jgi:hypothetical protein